MRRTPLFLIGLAVALASAIGVSWWQYQNRQWTSFEATNPKLRFEYPKAFQLESLPQIKERNLTFLFQANQGQLPTPLNVDLRVETGLRIVTSLTKQEMIPLLLGNADKTHPQRFSNYHKESERTFEHEGKKAAELYFTYIGPTGEKIKQRLWIIAYDPDTALYLAAQAKESDFDLLNRRYFDRIFNRLQF